MGKKAEKRGIKRSGRMLFTLIAQNKRYYASAVVCTIVTVVIGFMVPLIFSETVDVLLSGNPSNLPAWIKASVLSIGGRSFWLTHFWLIGVLVVALNIVSGVFSYYKERNAAMAGETIAKGLREQIYQKLSYLPFAYHAQAETGDLVQRSTSDVETIRHFLSKQWMEAFHAIAMTVIAFAILINLHAELTWYSMMLVPVILIASYVFFLQIHRKFQESDASEGKMSAVLQENLTGVRVVRAFGMQQQEVEKFNAVSRDFQRKADKLIQVLAVYWGGGDFLSLLQIMITLIICIVKAVRGEISVGTLIVFTSYVNMLLYPVRQLARVLSDAGKSMVSLARIADILQEEGEEAPEGTLRPPLDGDIVFDRVTFGYENDIQVLSELSMTIPAGKTVALLGNTGSGKSTVVHLLQRLYVPNSGTITIGGVNIQQIDRKYLREHIGLILQEPFLYGRSIWGNLAMAAPQASDDQIRAMSHVARADGFISAFGRGYDTLLGERGVTLSGGQRQRIAIARTLLKENDVLVFDDSLSAVDMQTDLQIREELRKSRQGITTIIISHRMSTLCEADRILVLENGKLSDEGTHQELTSRAGLYQQIFAIQSTLEDEIQKSHAALAKEEA